MRKILKSLFLVLSLSCFVLIGLVTTKAANTLADTIDVQLEQQENKTNNKIRYVATMSNVEDLANIVDIEITFTLSKEGETSRTAKRTITSVYTSIAGTNGKPEVDNTYYAVYTLTDTNGYPGYSLTTTFKFNYSDNSYEDSNTINYSIATDYTVVSYGTGSFEQSGSIEDLFTANSIENGNIFHAWNWSMSTIEANLASIKSAGFTAVQTSPMQPQKDYYAGNTAKDAWWKLYQPLGFVIAPDGCNNQIGTKSQLQSMVAAAHNIGLKVIVDVVANHLADANDSHNSLHATVQQYEPEIYGSDGTISGGAKIHTNTTYAAGDSSHTTDGNIAIVDLDTGNSVVQQRVLSLLKEYIDCGVDGFRFDAAKHIETNNPSEPNGSSQFWPTVINGATSYATEKGKEAPYYYGEILNGVGSSRSYTWYTDLGMDITANKVGNTLRGKFNDNKAEAVSDYDPVYKAGEYCVVWAESHDTYANDEKESPNVSIYNINKTYAIMGARNGAKALYLARPTDTTGYSAWASCTTKLGDKGSSAYTWTEVAAVNKFRNYWGTEAEYVANDSGFSMVVRHKTNESGMVLVSASSNTTASNVTVPTEMRDGSYNDLVSGNTFTVSGGKVSGSLASCGIAVLVDPNAGTGGSVSISSTAPATFYTDTMTATYTIKNAESATMTINGSTFAITSGAQITFGANMSIGDTFTVSITAGDVTKSFTYTKVEAPQVYKVYFEKPASWTNLYAHVWGGTGTATTWPGNQLTAVDGKYYFEFEEGAYDYVVFTDGTNKTEDITLTSENATYSLDDDTNYIYFVKPTDWSTVNAYMWLSDTVHNAEWPGATVSLDSTSGYYKVAISNYTKAIFNNGSTQTVDITFDTTKGAAVYKLSTEKDSKDHYYVQTALKVKAGTVCDHVYSSPVWTWNEYASANAKFTCTECGQQKTIAASVTSEITKEPTETETGTRTYTATVTFEGQTYTDTKEETIPTLDTVVEVPAVAATCGQAGNIKYYVKGDKYYSDAECENEITLASTVIPATGEHTVAAGLYTVGNVTCSTCGQTITPTLEANKLYVITLSGWNWSTCKVHVWGGTAETEWPGLTMTKVATVQANGSSYQVWEVTLPDNVLGYTGLKFHDGGSNNSKDLTAVSGANCYISLWDDYSNTHSAFVYIPEGN